MHDGLVCVQLHHSGGGGGGGGDNTAPKSEDLVVLYLHSARGSPLAMPLLLLLVAKRAIGKAVDSRAGDREPSASSLLAELRQCEKAAKSLVFGVVSHNGGQDRVSSQPQPQLHWLAMYACIDG